MIRGEGEKMNHLSVSNYDDLAVYLITLRAISLKLDETLTSQKLFSIQQEVERQV
jgi:hypothetical protein